MSSFTVRIETGNDAFLSGTERGRILREIADRVDAGSAGGFIRDTNGNTVAEYQQSGTEGT